MGVVSGETVWNNCTTDEALTSSWLAAYPTGGVGGAAV